MSGICGAWNLDGGATDLGPVLTNLERRGPDGTRCWKDGGVAIGHTLLATTPEALVEKLPLTDPNSGCTITADVRLDNRETLIAELVLPGEARTIGDGELILRAYLKWGEDCPKQLLGDFAFAIWNPRAQKLFCARDHMGMRQFNYCHVKGNFFAFATEDTALLTLEALPKALNEARIADFLDDLEGYDFTSTFFEAISRLPPAHTITITERGSDLRRYWQLRPPAPLELDSDQAYQAAFLKVFTEAVRCRLRHTGGIGAMLSGGLDSSSIVAVAAAILKGTGKGPLETFSAVGPEAAICPETTAIHSALGIDGLNPTLISPPDVSGMATQLISELTHLRNPFELHGTMLRSIYLSAKNRGVRVVIDGGAGDVTLTSSNRIATLLSKRKFAPAFREVAGQIKFWKPRRQFLFAAYNLSAAAWVAFVPQPIRAWWRALRFSKPLANLAPDFARRVKFTQRRLDADRHVSMKVTGEADRRALAISHPNLTCGRERFDQLSSAFAIECRDPFMDIRLMEFCLSLPPEQVEDRGWPKLILRRSMEGKIPLDLVWRRGKEHLGWDFTTALISSWEGWSERMRDPASPLGRYLSTAALQDLRGKPNAKPNGLNLRFFALDCFLRNFTVGKQRHNW